MAIPTLHNDITFAQEVKDGKHNYMNVAGISKYLTKLHRHEVMLKNEMKEKDYKEECIDKQKLMWSIIEFLQSINKFNPETDYDIVRNTVRKYVKKDRPVIKNTKIKISNSELESIVALKNDHLETLAFGILVIQKINNLKFNKKSNYFNMKSKDYYFEITKDKRNKDNQNKALAALFEANWIKLPSIEKFGETDGFYLNCIDLEIKDMEVAIEIFDYREIALIYKQWKNNGNGVGHCEVCKRLIEITSNNTQYCEKCSDKKKKENTNNRVKKHRKSKM